MKRILITLLIATAASSCSKNKVSSDDPILGSWHLVKTNMGLAGITTPAQSGHNKNWIFNGKSHYIFTEDGNTSSGKFRLRKAYSSVHQTEMTFLEIKNMPECTVSYIHDTLILSYQPELDGNVDSYVRN